MRESRDEAHWPGCIIGKFGEHFSLLTPPYYTHTETQVMSEQRRDTKPNPTKIENYVQQARSRADASVAVSARPRALWTRAHASRARGDSGFLFSALVAFGVRGKILTLAAKPTVPEWAGEANAVRMEGLVAIVA